MSCTRQGVKSLGSLSDLRDSLSILCKDDIKMWQVKQLGEGRGEGDILKSPSRAGLFRLPEGTTAIFRGSPAVPTWSKSE